MKRILHSLALTMALVAISPFGASAQRNSNGGRGNSNGSRTERTAPANRAGSRETGGVRPSLSGANANHNNGNHNSGASAVRPGNNHNNNNSGGVRPPLSGANGNHNGNHNGNNGNHNGWNNGNNGNPGYRPVPNRPAHVAPANRPAYVAPANRPGRPIMMRPVSRPLPPPAWRPRPGVPVIHGVLGLTFGIAINATLDYLYNSGYVVDGYDPNVVYLRNVPAMNYIWTDGALYYGARGLDASSFYYTTPVYDLTRYNGVYHNLVTTYGAPVSVTTGGRMSATWFGGNNGYITLSYGPGNGGRFLTTLTIGM